MKRSMSNLMFASSLVFGMFVLSAVSSATTVTPVTSAFWTPTTNWGRVLGANSAVVGGQWISYDVDPTRWVLWMNIGTAWQSAIPSGETITSATLTFNSAFFQFGGSNQADYSIFAVPGAGGPAGVNAAIGGTVGGEATYYGANTAYGLVTAAQIAADPGSPLSFDITNLLAGWKTGSLTTNVGQMMIVANNDQHSTFWNSTEGGTYSETGGPSITITSVPEPGAVSLLTMGMIGLLGYGRRRRK
jgi:hypothetical protein